MLTPQERRTVESFADAFIEGPAVISPAEVTANIDAHLDRISSKRTQSLRLTLFVIEHVLPRWSLWPFRKPFSSLTRVARKALITKHLQNAKSTGLLRDLSRIRTLFALGYYGDTRTHSSTKFIPVAKRAKYQNPDKLLPLGLPKLTMHVPATPKIKTDVCVIGSGAAGAVVAAQLAEQGRTTVLLEEGVHLPAVSSTHDEAAMIAKLYKESGLQATVDLDMAVLQGRCVGGSTVINNAICFRLNDPRLNHTARPDTLQTWARLGAHLDPTHLTASFDRVEKALGVGDLHQVQDQGVPPIEGNNANVLLRGWSSIANQDSTLRDWKSGLFRKNYNRCLGCGHCNFGCPYERKLSMLETYIPAAVAAGARVVAGCHATRIDTARSGVKRVECTLSNGTPLTIEANSVVVSCGAIGSSVLLMKSGITRNVGTRFSMNAGTPVFARFPKPIESFDGLQMGSYVDLGECLLESLFYPPMSFAVSMPGWFATHFERMYAYDRFACAGVLIGTDSNGRIKRTGLFRDLNGPIDYEMTSADLDRLKRGIARMAQVFFAAGAEAVIPATFVDTELLPAGNPTFAAILAALDERIKKPEDLTLSSAHPQGGNPMSDDPKVGVIDSQFRVHGHSNLFVCDASVFPTTIHINPQLTIMALADYFAHLEVV